MKIRAALLCALPCAALAAGLDIPELTAAGLARAGANAASPADASAFYYNPGALGYLGGLSFVLDARVINHQVRFQRAPQSDFDPVTNAAPTSVAPFAAVSYNFKKVGLEGLTVALGLHPALGHKSYQYPDPEALTEEQRRDFITYDQMTANRYVAVFSDNTILYPSLAAAYRVADWGSFGVTFQSAYTTLTTKSGIYAGPAYADADKTIPLEPDPTLFDAVVTLKTEAPFTPTAIAGAAFRFLEGKLRAGATLRLPHTIRTTGTLSTVLLNKRVEEQFQVKVTGDRVGLDLPYPLVLRAAAGWFEKAWDAELDFVFEGWSAMDKIVVTPMGISMSTTQGGTTTTTELKPISIAKNWSNALSLRAGGEVRLHKLVPALEVVRPRVRLGALFETSPIPSERLGLDFVSLPRATANVGLAIGFGPIDVNFAYARSFEGVARVQNSVVSFGTTDPDVQATQVGNGDYTSQLDLLAVSLGGTFDL